MPEHGNVGCCDSSPNKHASAHYAATGHPVMASFEPGEDWSWCFVDEERMRLTKPLRRGGEGDPKASDYVD